MAKSIGLVEALIAADRLNLLEEQTQLQRAVVAADLEAKHRSGHGCAILNSLRQATCLSNFG